MKNTLIFGSGRSGTSMLGGILHDAGYYMGENLYPARDSNPKGFFENDFINGINEKILVNYDEKQSWTRKFFKRTTSVVAPGKGQHWLSSIPESVDINNCAQSVVNDIKIACSYEGFAYKDPRFSYTLPVWEKYLPSDTVYIVLFREPSVVVSSIIKECSQIEYLKNMVINTSDAYSSWFNMYSHVLKNYKNNNGRYFFINYDTLLNGDKLNELGEFLNVDVSGDFIDGRLRRSVGSSDIPESVKGLYAYLNSLASKS